MSEETEDRTAARQLSRRELRRLRETGSTPEVSGTAAQADPEPPLGTPEYSEDLQALHADVTAASTGDPTHVDPELKRRQEEMAERALRENRVRRGLPAEPEADAEPEAETRPVQALGTDLDEPVTAEPDPATDSIRPVEASTAHGLDLEPAAEESSRSAARRSRLIMLLIVVIAILLVAVGVALFMPR